MSEAADSTVATESRPAPRESGRIGAIDVARGFALLGIFLEYWGTIRECWTYYTGQVPPPAAVVAHGFAALAFARAANAAERSFRWLALRTRRLREA